ncbi:MAG: hypothetical protein HZA66_01260 [Rhodopseudomonas palustris]|uniref:Uncharacterized protein n=1 Tax=Rhodopseudomonas palustris TaxID=1076 RepID=A0A933VSW4_RHOPL|nr:hypothetical protein [Rhodopseudomonas palustris]
MSSISSVSSTPVSKPTVEASPPPPPPPKDKDDSTTTQPVKAALPPGQGARVDQLA